MIKKILGATIIFLAFEAAGIGWSYLLDPIMWWVGAIISTGLLAFLCAASVGFMMLRNE